MRNTPSSEARPDPPDEEVAFWRGFIEWWAREYRERVPERAWAALALAEGRTSRTSDAGTSSRSSALRGTDVCGTPGCAVSDGAGGYWHLPKPLHKTQQVSADASPLVREVDGANANAVVVQRVVEFDG